MKKTLSVICAALMLSAPLASFAQTVTPQDDQQKHPQQGQQKNQPQQSHQKNQPQQGNQHKASGPGNNKAYRDPSFRPQPGMPVPHSQWKRGHVVAKGYRVDRYWVTDWQPRQLPAPPKNHRWLRINGDYVLVAVATGVIINILTGY
ncbi:RcnB family protein [Pseudomonas sp. Ma2-10]